jgi:tetratricopeptide (TPR) repeat protein
LFTLLGAAGVGKSRLVAEFLTGLGDRATVLRGRCLHYGEGITFWPLVEALMPVGERAGSVLDRLSGGGVATPEELFWEVRRLLEALATERPVVLRVDDLHWAEPTLLDLLDHITDLSRGAPIMLVCIARPELLEDRSGWGGGKLNATTVLLEPLAAVESEVLLDELGDGLDPKARARVIAASEGNPLFLEEMVALARERGTVEVPPTIQALLAARLERLGAEERELLERGAIEGEVFHRLAVKALAGERLSTEVELRLAGLVRKELIRPHPPTLKGDEAFRFRHLLIRDAAYDGLPKATRAELHERFASWLEQHATELVELDEIAGWHLEQAVRYQRELGREVSTQLLRRAAQHLYSAGRRAGMRADAPGAKNLLERALALAPAGEPLHALIAVELAEEEQFWGGDMARVDQLLGTAGDDPQTSPYAALLRLQWLHQHRPQEAGAAIEARLPGILARFEEAGDDVGIAKAHLVAAMQSWAAAQATPSAARIRLAAEHAGRAGDEGLRSRAMEIHMGPLIYGPIQAREMAAEFDRMARTGHGAHLEAFILAGRGEVARLEGRFAEACGWAARAIEMLGEMGHVMQTMGWGLLAETKQAEGDLHAAVEAFSHADALYEKAGMDGFRCTVQARIADAQVALGDLRSAREALELSERLGGSDDVINVAMTRRVRSELELAEGNLEEAERWARSAVEKAFESDFPFERAGSKLQLARVLGAAGRRAEAIAEAREALTIHEAKGDQPGMSLAQAVIGELERSN